VDFFNTNLRIDKSIAFGKFRVQLFMDISNVLNTLRLYVPNNQDNQNYMLSLHLPKSDDYDNIPGNDKFGQYREPGVEWQPEEFQNQVQGQPAPNNFRAIFYEGATGKYWRVVENPQSANGRDWAEIGQAEIDQINKDKAYIDMPNASTFWFLDPRKIYFGIRLSFDFNE
jgi:hypothetical protein